MAMIMPKTGALISGLPKVGHRHDLADALDEGDRRDVERDPAEDAAADDRHDRGVEAEQRHHQHGREHAREDQRLHRRDADRAHRVDFLGELHRADLRGEGRAGAAGDHDRGHQHAQLLHRRAADQVDRVDLGAELAELDRALLGDDDADQEAHQADDAERVDADHLELLGDRVEPEAARVADDVAGRDQQRAEEAEQAVERPRSRSWSRRRPAPSTRRQRRFVVALHLHRLVGLGDMVDQELLLAVGADDLRAAVALELVDQPGADRVHPLDLGEVDGQLARPRSRSAARQSLRTRRRVRLPLNRRTQRPSSTFGVEVGGHAHARETCFNSRRAARS